MNSLRPLDRREASEYLFDKHGIRRSPGTLAKLACVGGGPAFRKVNRAVIRSIPMPPPSRPRRCSPPPPNCARSRDVWLKKKRAALLGATRFRRRSARMFRNLGHSHSTCKRFGSAGGSGSPLRHASSSRAWPGESHDDPATSPQPPPQPHGRVLA
jgi:hypothetical protein